ncbi:MAG: hypothetical protein JWO19_494 [Bryobacterales bacterium]|nr:hypothetical protein [Bryobacterales bacterium]
MHEYCQKTGSRLTYDHQRAGSFVIRDGCLGHLGELVVAAEA